MTRSTLLSLMLLALLVPFLAACGAGEPGDESASPPPSEVEAPPTWPVIEVTTTSWPVHWLVEEVGGEAVSATCALPADADPASWRPSAEKVVAMQDAALVVANGAQLEPWLDTAALSPERLLRAAEGLPLIETETVTHSHGPHGAHSHGGVDPHVWGDPNLMMEMARHVRDALSEANPASASHYDENLARVIGELEALDADMRAALEGASSLDLGSNHPAYAYLARAYELEIRDFALDPDATPSAEEAARVAAWADEAERPLLLWEAAPTDEVVAALPEGLTHLHFDNLEHADAEGEYDYVALARDNLERLEEVLAGGASDQAGDEQGREETAGAREAGA